MDSTAGYAFLCWKGGSRDAMTTTHRLGSSTADIYFLSSEGLMSKMKVQAGLVSFEVSLLDLQMATLLLLLHLVLSLFTWIPGVSFCVLISS